MAGTGNDLLVEFRKRIRDTRPVPMWDDDRCYSVLTAALQVVAAKMPLGETWVLGAIVQTPGSEWAALPSAFQYKSIIQIRRQTDGYILYKRTQEELDRIWWDASIPAGTGRSDPIEFAFVEGPDQVVNVRFQSPAKTALNLDVLRTTIPDDLTTAGTEVVPFSRPLLHGIVDLAAADAVASMPDWELKELRLDRGYGGFLFGRGNGSLRDETVRRNNLAAVGRQMRYVP